MIYENNDHIFSPEPTPVREINPCKTYRITDLPQSDQDRLMSYKPQTKEQLRNGMSDERARRQRRGWR